MLLSHDEMKEKEVHIKVKSQSHENLPNFHSVFDDPEAYKLFVEFLADKASFLQLYRDLLNFQQEQSEEIAQKIMSDIVKHSSDLELPQQFVETYQSYSDGKIPTKFFLPITVQIQTALKLLYLEFVELSKSKSYDWYKRKFKMVSPRSAPDLLSQQPEQSIPTQIQPQLSLSQPTQVQAQSQPQSPKSSPTQISPSGQQSPKKQREIQNDTPTEKPSKKRALSHSRENVIQLARDTDSPLPRTKSDGGKQDVIIRAKNENSSTTSFVKSDKDKNDKNDNSNTKPDNNKDKNDNKDSKPEGKTKRKSSKPNLTSRLSKKLVGSNTVSSISMTQKDKDDKNPYS